MDLGSKNGTFVDGKRLLPHQEAWLSKGSVVGIGTLALTLAVGETPFVVEEAPSAFPAASAGAAVSSSPAATRAVPADFDVRRFLKADAPVDDRQSPTPPRSGDRPGSAAPSPPPPPVQAAVFVVGGTKVLQPARAGAWPPSPAPDRPPGASRIAKLIAAVQAEASPDTALDLTTALRALEVLLSGLASLRAGTQGTLDELGLNGPLVRDPANFRDGEEALAWLLADHVSEGRLRVLRDLQSDLLFHQIALLGALRDGVDSLLDQLDPDAPEFQARSIFAGRDALKRYREHFTDLSESRWNLILREAADSYASAFASLPLPEPLRPQRPLPWRPTVRLIGRVEPMAGLSFALDGETVVVGRDEDAGLRIDHVSVSRRHAILRRSENGNWTVDDLGSANGTFVNGEKYKSAHLEPGDEVAFGEVSFNFEHAPDLR